MRARSLILVATAVGSLAIIIVVGAVLTRSTSPTPVPSRTSAGPTTATGRPTATAVPDVETAAQNYVACMKAGGFIVSTDLFVAPQDVMEAEHSSSPAAEKLVAAYDAAWRTCSIPYQKAIDGEP